MKEIIANITTHQGHLQEAIEALFPNERITTNNRKDELLRDPTSGKILELDISVHDHKLSFEFQDPHHYITTWYSKRSLAQINYKDNFKRDELRKDGTCLIVVPCWWDGDISSLITTIKFHRPDMFMTHESASLIPLNPPLGLFHETGVPGVGELMLATFPMDSAFNFSVSVQNPWWVGEKYDGIRCCWNPRHKILYSRSGFDTYLPHKYIAHIPKIFLDGEIWFGRGNFQYSQNFLTAAEPLVNWDLLRMPTFDIPSKSVAKFTFEKRYSLLISRIVPQNPFIILAMRISLIDNITMEQLMKSMLENGGEGLIMRKKHSLYESGRTRSLVKLKVSANDAEAVVVDIDKNSITLQLPNERTIILERTQEIKNIHKGDIVTYSFDGYTSEGAPLNPSIKRTRVDVTWEDVVHNSSIITPHASARPFGYWVAKDGENMRTFFEDFARNLNLDPLDPEIWYNIPRKAIEEVKGGETIVKHFKGYVHALMQIFPEIGLEEHKFPSFALAKHWKKVSNRRTMFDSLAQASSFNPLVPENWYFITAEREVDPVIKGIVTNRYGGNYPKALAHVYPEVNLSEKSFLSVDHWKSKINRRKFFERIASKRSFDPLVPENWFPITTEDILTYQGAKTVLFYHHDSFARALEHLFPEFAPKLIHPFDMNYGNRKRYFENFAQNKGFNPFVAENWYGITNAVFLDNKGAAQMLSHYNYSLSKALMHLFPNIGITEDKFVNIPRKYYQQKENRRSLLIKFAEDNNFDPLVASNWYSAKFTTSRVMGMLAYYKYSLPLALTDLFPSIGIDVSRFQINSKYRKIKK